jgi:hypothetical protein
MTEYNELILWGLILILWFKVWAVNKRIDRLIERGFKP